MLHIHEHPLPHTRKTNRRASVTQTERVQNFDHDPHWSGYSSRWGKKGELIRFNNETKYIQIGVSTCFIIQKIEKKNERIEDLIHILVVVIKGIRIILIRKTMEFQYPSCDEPHSHTSRLICKWTFNIHVHTKCRSMCAFAPSHSWLNLFNDFFFHMGPNRVVRVPEKTCYPWLLLVIYANE